MMEDVMNSEKSYDSLPNFTAADSKLAPCELTVLFEFHVLH